MQQLQKAIEENPDMRFGEILFSIQHPYNMTGSLFDIEDEDLYDACVRFNTITEEEDEKLTDEEFQEWINKH
jgi:hypothetical protein